MERKEGSLDDMLSVLRKFTRAGDAPAKAEASTNIVAERTPPASTSVPVSKADAGNIDLARQLLQAINTYTGFRSTPSLERKLALVLRNVSASDVANLIKGAKDGRNYQDLTAIVEDLTNHETFFFRDTMQLDPLTDEFFPKLIRQRAKDDKRLRIWSAACATGEEAYTLTILALNALCAAGYASFHQSDGFRLQDGWKLEVLGTDISRQAIRVARAGCYQASSFGAFRQMPGGWQRYFVAMDSGPGRYGNEAKYMSVLPSISQHVRFDTFNLISSNPPLTECDVVLCRNVLIYIDHDRHKTIHEMISRSMRTGGVLVPSLVDQVDAPRLTPRWINRCAFYEKK
ncbi:MAG: hypothetical protein P1U67_01705 [Alcanivoracaceae bacterium]|nr:hypothetical protein [Alcanivoracaceae bacterium]